MFKFLIAAVAAFALAGCAQIGADFAAGAKSVSTGINEVSGALSSPAATQAAANLQAGATAIACDVSSASAVWTKINAAVKAGQAITRDAQTVYAVSAILCQSFGGTARGPETVPANAGS
jgi:hypothetical protein